jgi:hypothetical protein
MVEPVRTKVAFVGDIIFIASDRAVRACPFARTQMITFTGNDAHDTIGATLNGLVVTGLYARCVFTLHAQRRQEKAL